METTFLAGGNEYANHTTVHPLGVLIVLMAGLCVLFFSRQKAILPMLIVACLVPTAQRIVVLGLDFTFLRILLLFGLCRILMKREYIVFVFNILDLVVLIWVMFSILFFVIRDLSTSAFINRIGFAFDALGMYFLFRCLIQNWGDIENIVFGLIILSIPVSIFILVEKSSGYNLFSIFGGVPAITVIREGRLRCQGAFSHPIISGCFWASLIPLFAACWWKSMKGRLLATTGLLTSSIIIFCSSSSTPVMGVISSIVGGLFFYLRYRMRFVRWAVVLALISLHMVMNAPVWHLISRVSAVGGSTGWHRYNLINQAIIHLNDWWFSGTSSQTVASWGVWAGDVTNQYILEGVNGGIVTMLLFIILIITAFRQIGRLWRLQTYNLYCLALSWSLGVSLFVHCMNFIGVSYFGQIWILWYLLLAMIGSLSVQVVSPAILLAGSVSNNERKSHLRNQSYSRI